MSYWHEDKSRLRQLRLLWLRSGHVTALSSPWRPSFVVLILVFPEPLIPNKGHIQVERTHDLPAVTVKTYSSTCDYDIGTNFILRCRVNMSRFSTPTPIIIDFYNFLFLGDKILREY